LNSKTNKYKVFIGFWIETNKHIVFIGFSSQKQKTIKQKPIKPIKHQTTLLKKTQKQKNPMFWKLRAPTPPKMPIVSKTWVFVDVFWLFFTVFGVLLVFA
jgi:hypothetical protein